MAKPKPTNAANLDLIGVHFRPHGSVATYVVESVHPDKEGVVIAVNAKRPVTHEEFVAYVRQHRIT